MKNLVGIILICCYSLFSYGQKEVFIESVIPNVGSLKKYSLLELNIKLSAEFPNPYDPDEVDLYVEFISPGGKMIRINIVHPIL